MDQTAQVLRLQDENDLLRRALRDIAYAEPIPTPPQAFDWCKRVAKEAINHQQN